jgi:hypothetical protein
MKATVTINKQELVKVLEQYLLENNMQSIGKFKFKITIEYKGDQRDGYELYDLESVTVEVENILPSAKAIKTNQDYYNK